MEKITKVAASLMVRVLVAQTARRAKFTALDALGEAIGKARQIKDDDEAREISRLYGANAGGQAAQTLRCRLAEDKKRGRFIGHTLSHAEIEEAVDKLAEKHSLAAVSEVENTLFEVLGREDEDSLGAGISEDLVAPDADFSIDLPAVLAEVKDFLMQQVEIRSRVSPIDRAEQALIEFDIWGNPIKPHSEPHSEPEDMGEQF